MKLNFAYRFTFLITAFLSLSAIYYSYISGSITAYNDATAHLNTARRIIDNLTPGIVQIGSVWLPLLHILELPFVSSDFLWQTGLAGAIVSSISFVIASFFLYKLIFFITKNDFASILGVFTLITNFNLLYLQTTAMFEPLLIATALGAVYYLSKWIRERSAKYLIQAAFFTMLATLTRYDGWAFFLAACFFLQMASTSKGGKYSKGVLVIYLFMAGFGLFLWFLYNKLIFSDPLYFARSEYSAAAQQEILNTRGQLPTRNNFMLSFYMYSLSTIFNLGILTTSVLIIGLFVYLKRNFFRISLWPPLLLIIPFVFNVMTLYLGQSVIWLPMLPPYYETYFNSRYGILMLPAAAFFAGYLAYKHFILKLLISGSILFQVILFTEPGLLPLLGREIGLVTLQDIVSTVNEQTKSSSKFLHDNYKGGLIMVSSASSDAFIFRAGIPLKNYITEGTGYYWKDSLRDPAKYASWLVFFQDKSDRVGKAIGDSINLAKNFEQVYQDQTYQIWRKI